MKYINFSKKSLFERKLLFFVQNGSTSVWFSQSGFRYTPIRFSKKTVMDKLKR